MHMHVPFRFGPQDHMHLSLADYALSLYAKVPTQLPIVSCPAMNGYACRPGSTTNGLRAYSVPEGVSSVQRNTSGKYIDYLCR